MKMNVIKNQETYGDRVLVDALSELKNNINQRGVIGLFQAPTGVGKTHSGIQLITPLYYNEKNVRFVLFVAPQKQLISRVSLNGHIKQLKKQGYLVTDLINGKIGEIENSLVDRDNEEIVFVSMSDSFFNRNQSSIERLINTYNLQGQTLILLDEVHYGSTSDREYYQDNTGNIPSGYNAVKYHNIVKLLQTCYVLGLTATPTKEQLVDDFGTPLYVPMNTYPPKEELWKRTSSYQTPIFYDWQGWGMEKSLMKFFEMVSDHQTLTDAEADELNLPEECRVKFCGGVKIETPYLNKTKDDKHRLINYLNSGISIPKHWDYDFSLDTSEGIIVWRFNGGCIQQLDSDEMRNSGYVDSDSLIQCLRNKNSRLRFLCVVNKGTMGIDISNLNFGLSLRVPGTNDTEGNPVTLSGEQWNGRFSRITIPIETLSKYFDNKEQFIKYYTMVNSYRQMLPESDYWRTMMENISQKLNSVDEVVKIFSN